MQDTIIDLLRHGEPEGGRRYRGHNIDDPLTEKGWSQMWQAVGDFKQWDHIVSSPLQRCTAFANALAEKHNIPVSVEDNLKEVGFGTWEGKTPDELKQANVEEFDAFYADPVNNRPEGAEPLQSFFDRVSSAFKQITEIYAGKHCLLIAHAGVNRAIIANAIEASAAGMYRIDVKNAGLSRIKVTEKGMKLMFHNYTSLPE